MCNPMSASPRVPHLLLFDLLTLLNLLILLNLDNQLMCLLVEPATRLHHLSNE